MKCLTLAIFLAWTVAGVQATNLDEAVQAVLKAGRHLANQSSYSWVSTSKAAEGTDSRRQGPTHGKTEKGGPTHVHFMLGEGTIELGFKGDKAAIKMQDQWHGLEELQGDRAWIADRLKAYKFPAEEAAFLARRAVKLAPVQNAEGDLAGELNAEAVLDILSRGRQVIQEAPHMQGKVVFRIKDGELSRYEYTVAGRMTRPGQDEETVMDRTTVVEIHGVRETKVELSEECLSKLR